MPDGLVTTLYVVVPALVVFLVGGLLLPRQFKVSRSIVIAAPAEKIHPHLDSFAKWPAWSPFDTQDPKIVWEKTEKVAGVGARRSWKSKKMGDGAQWIVASDPKKGVAMKLEMADGCMPPFDIDFAFAPDAGGTRVTWTDSGTLPSAPHWRWMFIFAIRPMLYSTFGKGLAALKREVEAA